MTVHEGEGSLTPTPGPSPCEGEGGFTPTPDPSPCEGEGSFIPSLTPKKPNMHPSLLSLRFPIKLALRYILAVRPLPPAIQKGHDPI